MSCRRLPLDFSDLDLLPRKRARLTPVRRSAVHPASQVDPIFHTPALMDLLSLDVSQAVKEYIVDVACDAVDFAIDDPISCSRSGMLWTRPDKHYFSAFASNVIENSGVAMPVLLVALVYIRRARGQLRIDLDEWAYQRVFLGALIAASKYTNDTSPKAAHWSAYTGTFGKRDVALVEREFLGVLDYRLGITEEDLLVHYDALLCPPVEPVELPFPDAFPLPPSRASSPQDIPELEPSSAWSPESECPSPVTPPAWTPQGAPSLRLADNFRRRRRSPRTRAELAFHEATRNLRTTMPLRLPQHKFRLPHADAQLLRSDAHLLYSAARLEGGRPYTPGRLPQVEARISYTEARDAQSEARHPHSAPHILSPPTVHHHTEARFLRTGAPLLSAKAPIGGRDVHGHGLPVGHVQLNNHVTMNDHVPVILHGRTRSQIAFLDCL
ncbi:hypothetical protein BD626DRAFT_536765 [Schizophyllum amplum]|uniref:Cyclin N-terminal domain-containing protein n=1 Tax=Schizophyllum amplum TaxID=97359 RepID=A0A550CH69_9AGAR|nr:hypothetical protein BD626DRAFT_536765 [Auriculariopsis ampla]